jgi:hypothetical protein
VAVDQKVLLAAQPRLLPDAFHPPMIHILESKEMKIDYPEIGVCGLSCRLCPMYNSKSASRCAGCKSEGRMKVGCPFIACAVKKKGLEFCWQCPDHEACEKWHTHRELGRSHDSFVCYQRLENNIAFIEQQGISAFEADQKKREHLLSEMLDEFNEGRSKSYYCIVATVMDTQEIAEAIAQARDNSAGADIKTKSKALHAILDKIAQERGYNLKLRKKPNA